jgi:hypothetical protein
MSERLVEGRGARVGDARLQAGRVVVGGEGPFPTVEQRGRDGLVTGLGPRLDVGADVPVDAEDLLDDHDPAFALGEGGLVEGGELETVRACDLDRLAHPSSLATR